MPNNIIDEHGLVSATELRCLVEDFLEYLGIKEYKAVFKIYEDNNHTYKHKDEKELIQPEKLPFDAAIYIFYLPSRACPNEGNDELGKYINQLSSQFLKIGVVGNKSDPRFKDQHYGFNANSTLALSLTGCKFGDNPLSIQKYCQEHIGKYVWLKEKKEKKKKSERIGESELEVKYKEWIKDNTQRLNIIFKGLDNTNRHLPAFIEKYLHYRLRRVFEGAPEDILEEQSKYLLISLGAGKA